MASQSQALNIFVRDALLSGRKKEEIATVLADAGWPAAEIGSALDTFADTSFSIPVPRPRPSLNAREAFLYLVMFGTLYFGAWHLGDLLFYFVDKALPDPAQRSYFVEGYRWPTAAIIVAFPIFLFMAQYLGAEIRRNPSRRLSPVRRWLTYLTLVLSTVALVSDVTELIYSLLGGELTARFLWKVLIVAAIAGAIFAYYLLDLRKEERE
jgi:hypothetical protein